jgi:hypothetical protein
VGEPGGILAPIRAAIGDSARMNDSAGSPTWRPHAGGLERPYDYVGRGTIMSSRSNTTWGNRTARVFVLTGLACTLASASSMPMPLIAPLFIEDQQRTSIVTIVNNEPDPVTLDVVLYSMAGKQLATRPLTLAPHTQQSVPIADLVQASGAGYGSVVLMPHRSTTVAAPLSIIARDGAPLGDIEEEFSMSMSSNPSNYRAVSVGARPLLAVTSLSTRFW